jgi:hypothetical protein
MNVTCDGFEVETLINVRVARAGLAVAEVPSIEPIGRVRCRLGSREL